MSTRTNLRPQPVITNGDMSANITSSVTLLQSLSSVSFMYYWSGTAPVGTVSIQVSNDYSLNSVGAVANAGHWVTVELNLNGVPVASIPLSGNSGQGFIDVEPTAAYAIRTVYTFTSGVGTLNSVINGKVS